MLEQPGVSERSRRAFPEDSTPSAPLSFEQEAPADRPKEHVPFAADRRFSIHVLKFGSSILANPGAYRAAAREVRAEVGLGVKVVVVVSAMGTTTNALLASASTVDASPPDALVSALLATGEEASAALFAIALAGAGLPALALPSWKVPIHTRGPLRDADPVHVDGGAITEVLRSHDAVVVPGFVGLDVGGAPSLLGRGGSDLTALFLGYALHAREVRLLKDVDGVFPADPKRSPEVAPLRRTTCDEVRRLGGGVVQEKALAFAARHGLGFRVAVPGGRGTWIGSGHRAPPAATLARAGASEWRL